MNERVPLSFLLAQNKDEEPPVEPIVPFPAMFGEDPRIVTAVLERTAILASTEDKYERAAQRHDQVLVDPAMVQWRTRTSDSQGNRLVMPTGKGRMAQHRQPSSKSTWHQTNGLVMGGDQERKATRDLSDERALKNQQEVRSTEEKEMRFLRQRQQAERPEEKEVSITTTTSGDGYSGTGPGPGVDTIIGEAGPEQIVRLKPAKKEKLRHCHTCGLDKQKSEFKTQRGIGLCNDCRDARGKPSTVTATVATVQRRKGKKGKRRGRPAAAAVLSTGHRNGRPSLTLKELMTSVKAAIAERDELRKAVSTLRQEKAELYTQLQELVG